MALYRSPLTVTLWPSSFLKKYGPMIPPAHKGAPNMLVIHPSVHRRLPWFLPQTTVSPPTPCHHFSYNDSPASQSGSFMLPIQDSTTTTGNIHCSVMGRRNAPCSMSQ
ncbi:hypothetical protein TNCV_979261 [Trichonephila clavipes]|nr:hypothetical protein TNCV_979261 [Trichonephila clavipes]